MFVTKDKLQTLLLTWGIEPREPGDGNLEFEIIDRDFRGHVRFKDFLKFVKRHLKGKAYDLVDNYHDSSISSSELIEKTLRDSWREIDPERNCKVSYDAVANWFEKEFGLAKSDTMSIIGSDIDNN